ncbi:MAG: hypothetical protein CVU38_00740 [Chloroflexi bacterium HGW-Chloroflexi-1]|nr:MAG: hypothetical protein CVU38_00740 [Chloroflexi bacterium HGW-Chloroflexi-1]
MSEVLTAVYERGVLRPLGPVGLCERQTVRLQILPEEPIDEAEQVIRMLVRTELLTPPAGRSALEPISEAERREAADALGRVAGKPLSEIIIEERGLR